MGNCACTIEGLRFRFRDGPRGNGMRTILIIRGLGGLRQGKSDGPPWLRRWASFARVSAYQSERLACGGPIHAVDAGRQVDRWQQFPILEVQDDDLAGGQERNVSDVAVGADQSFGQGCRRVEGFEQLARVEVDYEDVALHAAGDEVVAVGSGLGAVN